jgi:colanic acid biosynthesis protein WcaH
MAAMTQTPKRLPVERWAAVVRDAPLVSIDLVVRDPSGAVLLGWRSNEPAKACWFVPGGVIRKGERITDAFRRITDCELGETHELAGARLLGVHEHFYATNFREEADYGTHYVVLAHEIEIVARPASLPTEQHARYRWCAVDELLADEQVHVHVKRYFE